MNNSELNNNFFIFIYDLANTILVILLPQLGHTMSYPAEPLKNLMSLYQFHSRSSFLHPHLSQSCSTLPSFPLLYFLYLSFPLFIQQSPAHVCGEVKIFFIRIFFYAFFNNGIQILAPMTVEFV